MKRIKVKSLSHLKKLAVSKDGEFRLLLNGGLYSKKIIGYSNYAGTFSIVNCIDNSKELLTSKEMMDTNITNIGKAITLGALIYVGKF